MELFLKTFLNALCMFWKEGMFRQFGKTMKVVVEQSDFIRFFRHKNDFCINLK
jgi:hypothetical protein